MRVHIDRSLNFGAAELCRRPGVDKVPDAGAIFVKKNLRLAFGLDVSIAALQEKIAQGPFSLLVCGFGKDVPAFQRQRVGKRGRGGGIASRPADVDLGNDHGLVFLNNNFDVYEGPFFIDIEFMGDARSVVAARFVESRQAGEIIV